VSSDTKKPEENQSPKKSKRKKVKTEESEQSTSSPQGNKWEVESVIDECTVCPTKRYSPHAFSPNTRLLLQTRKLLLVKWKGFSDEDSTWEPKKRFCQDAAAVYNQFLKSHPQRKTQMGCECILCRADKKVTHARKKKKKPSPELIVSDDEKPPKRRRTTFVDLTIDES